MAKRTSKEIELKIIEAYKKGNSSIQIQKEFKISPTTVCRILKRYDFKARSNEENSRRYFLNENYFKTINTEHKAYWLGFIYADGFISIKNNQYNFGISLSKVDIFHLEKLKKDLEATYPINIYQQTQGYSNNEYCRLLITSQLIVESLIKHGVFENKTNILNPPTISKKLIPHFIRGYLDGDGCITSCLDKDGYRKWAVKILGTDSVLTFIKDFIEENNVTDINKFYKRKEEQTVSCLELGGNEQCRNFLDLIYNNASVYLDRKFVKYIDLCNFNNNSRARKKFQA